MVSLAAQSSHPLSQAITTHYGDNTRLPVSGFKSVTSQGICGWVQEQFIEMGSAAFVGAPEHITANGSVVFVAVDGQITGYFSIGNHFREGIPVLLKQLQKKYGISLLSGDNNREMPYLRKLLGPSSTLLFTQQPQDKLNYIIRLQKQGNRVLMIGDGLNDAGALKQSDAGISIADNSNSFTPASDGILEAAQLLQLPHFIKICRANKRIIIISFIISLIYNITGLFFAVQGILSPLTAAILMPASSISIILITYGLSEWADRH
jgi:Cu+-exporting ATPase